MPETEYSDRISIWSKLVMFQISIWSKLVMFQISIRLILSLNSPGHILFKFCQLSGGPIGGSLYRGALRGSRENGLIYMAVLELGRGPIEGQIASQ